MNGERVEVDDLFGDSATLGDTVALNLPLQSIPVEGLAQYLDSLRRASTQQRRLAWSRLGSVAALSSDSLSVSIRYLVFSTTERRWDLSKEHIANLSANGHNQHPILQLEWSQAGTEVALADAAGRITIISISAMALNETTVVRPAILDREDELSQALAMYWLNMDRQYPTLMKASKDQGRWTYMAAKRRPMGPFWPRAVLVVTRKGGLILHYQRPDGRWIAARADLRSLKSTGHLLTHAAIAPTQENKLLVAVQNSGRQLLVYLVSVHLPDPSQDPHMNTPAKMIVENVRASVSYKIPKPSNAQADDPVLFDGSSHFLSNLEIVPTSDVEKAIQLPPIILAFYTPVINPMGMANDGHLGTTTVRRWHVVSAEHKLNPSFDSVQSKASSSAPSRRSDLKRLEDVHINQLITTVQKVDGGEQLALGCADGSLALYDPLSLTPLYMAADPAEVSSMAQAGFVFSPYSSELNRAVSPNACVAASLGPDGKVQLTHLLHTDGLSVESTDVTSAEPAIAAIILTFARSFYSPTSWNDIMLLAIQHLDPMHYPQFTQSVLKDLLSDADFMPERGNAKKLIVARALSLTASLGHDPSTNQRTHASMLSWISLNIRFCSLAFIRIWSSVNQNGGVEWKDPEVCETACNNIRWTLDLCKFIVDDLFEMSDHANHLPSPAPETDSVSARDPLMISKLLLLSIWPRSFLNMILRILRGLARARQDPKITLAPEAVPAFRRMIELIEGSSLKLEPLEQILIGVDKIIQQTYQLSGMAERDKAEAERYILSHGQIPAVLQNVVTRILQDVLPSMRPKLDRLSLYTEDYSWLGIRNDRKTEAFKRDYVVDVHRKRVMKKKGLGKVRKCVRCGSISAVLVRVRHWPPDLQTQMMLRCVCEDVFAMVESEDL